MKKRTEETLFQKIVVLIVEISIAAILIFLAVVMDFVGGYLLCLPFVAGVIIEFFRKDGQNIIFKSSGDETTPYDGELVSYQEYPEENKGVNYSQGYDRYKAKTTSMDDLYLNKK